MLKFKNIFQHVLRSWRHHFLLQLGSLVVITSSLTVVFSIFLFFANTEKSLVSWGSAFDINIFLKDGLKQDEISAVKTNIENLGYFKQIDFVNQKAASEKFFSKISKYIPDFTNQKDFANLIPASFVGTIAKKVDLGELQNIASNIQNLKGVEDISYGQEWLDGLSSFLHVLKRIGFYVSGVLITGCFFVIAFSVYAVLARRRDEVEIFELCGATSRMIQTPFVTESIFLSFIAAILAVIASYFILQIENQFFISKMNYLGFSEVFEFARIRDTCIFVLASMGAGGIVSLYCTKKINTGWSQAERENHI